MKPILLIGTMVLGGLASKVEAESWTCSAPGLLSGSYDGGATAYIHLAPYQNGNSYPVVKKGKTAIGKTSNGTSFVCTQK